MSRAGEFSKDTVLLLSRRAALRCSNPDCGALTTGPDAEGTGAINIGEAAHIYACAAGGARFNPALSIGELSTITNAIWLCCNCHKSADDDEARFPAELLFEWRRQHEHAIVQQIGSKTERIREKINLDKLRPFEAASYLAQQIVLDRPPFWEYRLTAELLRTEMGAVHSKWRDLQRGLYVRKSKSIPFLELRQWFRTKMGDAIAIALAFNKLVTLELSEAWGPPGKPGNASDILRVCRLITTAAENFLEWEEDLRFNSFPDEFEDLQRFLQGMGGTQLEEMMRIPDELSKIFEAEKPSGIHKIDLAFKLPDTFVQDFKRILSTSADRYIAAH